ncbi:isopropylmalate isomerase [Streptomyces avermitilis]|uniref:3-isopropylmalate dehydratase small subunit n=2 Tax=Streptomyces avermitilis TaxID=33903 RepID=A0A143SZB7_STRAW|nr:3-isopropylmalate dehydratase small subunit [Streptomyces avermitilis]KUN47768.1 isopropylmalate isomerase [Streptomyces avermitilis]BAU77525.1 putative isopropylmalate isomerase small subunit [Streptomyces avermitilis MA-4680 = NBRC 14893]BBJ56257.1 3-isopropylmalate dehydratase small subunit [Streptomyces avermitilis]GDY70193.1 3-isopropylmalate dehydratase small subunit [Streptomyces avermitilis]GDY80496.1 3-isopropylmalate dehydratase small subunit [Streptomyces avermitilis]
MKPLTEHVGRGVSLRRSNVDTDQIIPAEFCKRITKSGFDDALFATWRKEPKFVLNRPERQGASILVASHNFGTGSSREHAVWALRDWGFRVVIATSYGDIFRRNSFTNGLLAVELAEAAVNELAARVEDDSSFEITVDLMTCEVRANGQAYGFEVEERARWLLLKGLDEISLTLLKDEAVREYELTRPHWLPTIKPTPLVPAAEIPEEARA